MDENGTGKEAYEVIIQRKTAQVDYEQDEKNRSNKQQSYERQNTGPKQNNEEKINQI